MLLFKNLLFTLSVPGPVAVYVPRLMTRGHPLAPEWSAALLVPAFIAGRVTAGLGCEDSRDR